jgi:hypothetical protein
VKKKQLRKLTTLTPASDEQTINKVVVPFHPPIANKLQAIFKKHQIKMVHSTRGKLGEHLGNPKDQVDETLQKSIKLIVWNVLPYTLDNPDAASQQDSTTITETFVKIILSFQVLPIT